MIFPSLKAQRHYLHILKIEFLFLGDKALLFEMGEDFTPK